MTQTATIEPPVLAIDPRSVSLNADGFAFRSFMARLPEGAIADDLKEPAIWRKVQRGSYPLRKHDHVYVVAYDESWVAEAIVVDADTKQAVLAKPRITQFPPRFDKLFETDEYRVAWVGNGYRVQRKSDGQFVTQAVHSAALAERDLNNMYPRRA
jgi:hypothetical protein